MATAIRKFSGTGSPEGAVSAPPGSTYIQTDGASGSEIWDKATGTGNTGWRVRGSGTGGSTNGEFPDPVTITSNTTADVANYLYLVNAASGAVTLTLPTAVGNAGKEFVVKKIDSSSNVVTIDASGSQTIDGELTLDTATQNDAVAFQSNGSNWYSTTPPSGAGGGSSGSGNISGAYDIEGGTYTDAGMSDEFASGTLNAKWTTATSSGTIDFPGQPGSGVYDLTTRSGTLLLQPAYSTSAETLVSLRQTDELAVGESLVMSCALPHLVKYTATAYQVLGIYLNSSTTSHLTGTWNSINLTVNLSGTNSNAASIRVADNTTGNLRAYATSQGFGERIYLRITRKSVNSTDSFLWFYSMDGISWNMVWMNTAQAFTQMWVAVTQNTQTNPSISSVFPIHWIRHVASTAHDLW